MSIIHPSTLQTLEVGFGALFQERFEEAQNKAAWSKIASYVPSTGRINTYGWLSALPQMEAWTHDRAVRNSRQKAYQLENKKFETTIGVSREDIEDGNVGQYGPLFQMMGQEAADHVDRCVFETLRKGFTEYGWDGVPFFGTHTIYETPEDRTTARTASNLLGEAAATGAPWFLMDTSKPVKPLVFQERTAPEITSITTADNDTVFLKDEYFYGVRTRRAFGYGLWQLAFASKEDLTAANFDLAYQGLLEAKTDGNKVLGLRPTYLVAGPSLRAKAMAILKSETIKGLPNANFGLVDLIISPYLA